MDSKNVGILMLIIYCTMSDSWYVSLGGKTLSWEPPQQMLWTIKYLGRKEEIELRKEIYLYVSSSQKHLWEVAHKAPNMRMFLSVPLALYWTAEWLSEHEGIQNTAPAPGHYTYIHLRYCGGHQTGTGTPSLLGYTTGTVFGCESSPISRNVRSSVS